MKILLKTQRKALGLKSRELAQLIGVDQALISKFESGERIPTEAQVKSLERVLKIQDKQLTILWLKEKILQELNYHPNASDAIQLVREEIEAYSKQSTINLAQDINDLLEEIDALK